MFDGIVNYIKERPILDAIASNSVFKSFYVPNKLRLINQEQKQQQQLQQQLQQQQAKEEEEKEKQQQEILDKAEETKNQAYAREDSAYSRMISDLKRSGVNVGLLSSLPTPVSSLSNAVTSGEYNLNSQQLQHIQNLDLQEVKNDFDYLINSINNNVTIEENQKSRLVNLLNSLFNLASSFNMANAIKGKTK